MASPSTPPIGELGSSRYELRRPLGKGGAGAVFLALDRETGEEVALKKLFRVDHRSVQRFKREFRAIADLHHPNLVKLYDLQRAEDAWFLTMEYVDGADLQTELLRETGPRSTQPAAHIERVSRAFHQLALAVQAVHRAGMLHRDLKPSNVVVAKSGRVVVLDFGLVRELSPTPNLVTMDGSVAGTPAYMAPEQALGLELTPASDWYAFGVMLYQMLSGVLPIDGPSPIALVQRKLVEDPKPLAAQFAPRPLADLCMALLKREPSERPDAASVLHVLATLPAAAEEQRLGPEENTFQTDIVAPTARAALFGRDAEISQLYEALGYVSEGRSAIVHVRGTSGSGKSSLIEYFLDELDEARASTDTRALVLRSRCYEREAMPFKALDGIIDALVNHLSKLDELELAHLLPSEIHSLIQVFPAFERLPVVQTLLASGRAARGDAAQIRRNAERGLRQLFLNTAKLLTLVMWIDDLQWGDLDSATLLQDWLERPAEAPILIILSYRSDELTTSSCLRQLVGAVDPAARQPRFELTLSPLRNTDIERLCEGRIHANPAWSSQITERIVTEAKGDPFLALQLTALAQVQLERGQVDLPALSVEELVVRTSTLLSEPARALLRVLAVAGRPLVPQLALVTAGVLRDGRSHIHALQGLRMVRTRIVDGVRLLEVYHDRVREAISASLTAAESVQLHERLLHALELSGHSDPAWLHALALGAEQRALALRYGQLAAQIATSSLAFERSAELYARCLTLTDVREELAQLWSKLALALARCRRGAEAADAYIKAVDFASESERVNLLQQAASHLLRSGRYDEGEQLVLRVMEALDIEFPASQTGLYAAIVWERLRYSWLARTVKPVVGIQVPAETIRRGEFYGMLAVWTAAYSPLRAALFQLRTVCLTLSLGEVSQLARSMCLTATIESLTGTDAAARRVEELLAQAKTWGDQAYHPNFLEEWHSARATCALMLGRSRDTLEPASLADEIYSKKSALDDRGDYYTMFTVRTLHVGALQGLGRHQQAIAELRELIASALATDNITTILQISLCVTVMEHVLDLCAGSRARLDAERPRLPTSGIGPLHVMHLAAVLRAATTTIDFDWGQQVIDELWERIQGSPVRRSAYLSYVMHVNLARFLLNRHVVRAEPGDPERTLRRCLNFLASKAPAPLRKPSVVRLRARIAYLRGDKARASELFQESISLHQELGVADDAARDRYALACLTPGEEGEAQKRSALAGLLSCGVLSPQADVRAYYPELF